ncbi:MAG: hypothetical protein QOJ46_1618 [bacterium]|jgi:hypothetical protein
MDRLYRPMHACSTDGPFERVGVAFPERWTARRAEPRQARHDAPVTDATRLSGLAEPNDAAVNPVAGVLGRPATAEYLRRTRSCRADDPRRSRLMEGARLGPVRDQHAGDRARPRRRLLPAPATPRRGTAQT